MNTALYSLIGQPQYEIMYNLALMIMFWSTFRKSILKPRLDVVMKDPKKIQPPNRIYINFQNRIRDGWVFVPETRSAFLQTLAEMFSCPGEDVQPKNVTAKSSVTQHIKRKPFTMLSS